MPMDMDAHLRTLARSLGADYLGVADLSSAHEFILAQGGDRVARYQRAVAIGMVLQDSLVDLLPDKDLKGAILYRHNTYDVMNQMLDQIGIRVANELQEPAIVLSPYLHRSVLTTRTSAVSSPRNLRHISRVLAGSERAAYSSLLITDPVSAGSAS